MISQAALRIRRTERPGRVPLRDGGWLGIRPLKDLACLTGAALLLLPPLRMAAQDAPVKPAADAEKRRSFFDPVLEFGRDSILAPKAPFELVPGKDPNGWGFVLEPYVWAMGLNGDVGVKGLPASHIDASSRAVIQNLDWGIFARGEVRKGRWGILADGYYAALSGSGEMGNHLYQSGSLQVQQSLISLALAYRVIDDRRGFLDVYAGARYNYLGLQASEEVSSSGIETLSTGVTNRVAAQIDRQVQAAVQAARAEVLAAVSVAKQSLDARVAADLSSLPARITADARSRIGSTALQSVAEAARTRAERRLVEGLRDLRLDPSGLDRRSRGELRERGIDPRRVENLKRFYTDLTTIEEVDSVIRGRSRTRSRGALVEYLRASVDLEVAKLRGEETSALERKASAAKARASRELAADIEEALPTYQSGDQWWFDPIIGVRGQVNFTRWLFLAAQADVGGFGAGSQIAWNVQSTIGFQFTRNLFAEFGYRYMYVDYTNGGFLYNMNSYGLFSGIGVKF